MSQVYHLCLKHFILNCQLLHSLPKFVSRTKNILVGSDHDVGVLFVTSVVVNLHGFEVYTLVSDIHDNVDMVMGIRIAYETEGVINIRGS